MHGHTIDGNATVVIVATNQYNWKWDIGQKYLEKLDMNIFLKKIENVRKKRGGRKRDDSFQNKWKLKETGS